MSSFDYTRIENLDYFDSRDVIERRAEIDAEIENGTYHRGSYELAELRLERLILWTILEDIS